MIRAGDRDHALGERPRLVLSSTANPKSARRPSAAPILTLERGLGRTAAPTEAPAPTSRLGIFRAPATPHGQTVHFLGLVDTEGRMEKKDGRAAVVAEVRLYGVGELAHNEAIAFLSRMKEMLDDVGYDP